MRILFDQGTPLPLRTHLARHTVVSAFELGWSELENGELLAAAEANDFDIVITTDQKLRYQQNLSDRTIAVIVLLTTNWPRIESQAERVIHALAGAAPGSYIEISFSD